MEEGNKEVCDSKDVLKSISNTVSIAILEHLVKTGGCAKDNMVNLSNIDKETESALAALKTFGLVTIEGDTVTITGEGRKIFENLEELEKMLEG